MGEYQYEEKIANSGVRAVHNFCTSQKAVSNSSHGVIGGAHRGGKLAIILQVIISNNTSTPPRGGSLPKPHHLSYYIPQSSRRSIKDSYR
jgi:hypothetical protein